MNAKIGHISYHLPKKILTNDELDAYFPTWNMKSVVKKTGVYSRHIADDDETALDLSVAVCKKFFAETNMNPSEVDAILYCTQSPDYIMPPNALLLHRHFDFRVDIPAFDINLACSGYVYALAIAKSMVVSGMANNVLLVTADTYSKYINPRDRSTRSLFGDGAAVTLVEPCDDNCGILSQSLASDGKFYKKFYIPAGGQRKPKSDSSSFEDIDAVGNVHNEEQILMDGIGIWNYIRSKIPGHIESFLKKSNVEMSQINQFIFHQASQLTLDSLVKVLKINPDIFFTNLKDIGNTVSSSIPIAIADARTQNKIQPGDLVLISGFGVGLSYGSMLIRF
jgi:3-oxoacyl-[acyl-carrier-protein] synthase-3